MVLPGCRLSVDTYRSPCKLVLDRPEVGGGHERRERVPARRCFPAEQLFGLGRVAEQVVDLGRTQVVGIDLDVLLPLEPGMPERGRDEVADRRTHPGCE